MARTPSTRRLPRCQASRGPLVDKETSGDAAVEPYLIHFFPLALLPDLERHPYAAVDAASLLTCSGTTPSRSKAPRSCASTSSTSTTTLSSKDVLYSRYRAHLRVHRRRTPSFAATPVRPRPPRPRPRVHYPETAAGTPVIAYIDDEPFLPEQPDAGAQELDATVDNDSYYTGGAYYYVQAADDDQE